MYPAALQHMHTSACLTRGRVASPGPARREGGASGSSPRPSHPLRRPCALARSLGLVTVPACRHVPCALSWSRFWYRRGRSGSRCHSCTCLGVEDRSADRTQHTCTEHESSTPCTVDHSDVSIDLSHAPPEKLRHGALILAPGSHRHHTPLRSHSGVRLGRFDERGGRCGGGRGGGRGGDSGEQYLLGIGEMAVEARVVGEWERCDDGGQEVDALRGRNAFHTPHAAARHSPAASAVSSLSRAHRSHSSAPHSYQRTKRPPSGATACTSARRRSADGAMSGSCRLVTAATKGLKPCICCAAPWRAAVVEGSKSRCVRPVVMFICCEKVQSGAWLA